MNALKTVRRAFTLFGIAVWLVTFVFSAQAAESKRRVPTIEDLLLVRSAGNAKISPDGGWVAYSVTQTDFKQDSYVTHIWLAETSSGKTFQFTRGEKSCTGHDWSPDGKWLAFLSSRAGDKDQIFAISPLGGEAIQLTNAESGVTNFRWSPDGKSIAFSAFEPVSKPLKDRKEYLDDYEVVRKEYKYAHLWTIDVAEAMKILRREGSAPRAPNSA